MTGPPIVLTDSRRLTGPNLLGDRPGAVLEVRLDPGVSDLAITEWEASARRMLTEVGWAGEACWVRRFPGGASLAISAPPDTLFAATEVNEWALAAAGAALGGPPAPDLSEAVPRLRALIAAERKPALLALAEAAAAHRVTLLADTEQVSVGTGTGSRTWPLDALPPPGRVDWQAVHDVPTVLVTGCNGKTTTVRLLTAMLTAQGRVAGMCCSDSIQVGADVLDRGDWSGPGGARTVLRDRRVEVAVLETARGGMLRRGLAMTRADAAIITNVAEDHFGEFGITDLAGLAEAKFIVARALGPGAPLVLNAEDPWLVARAASATGPIVWFALEPTPLIEAHLHRGGEAGFIADGAITLCTGGHRRPVLGVGDAPVTRGGTARHNVANALGAAILAARLGVDDQTIARGLAGFRGSPAENPGRLNFFELGGVTVVVDYAHNPHGMDALVAVARTLPARRRLVLLGQAGDRDDVALRGLARSAWGLRPDRIIIKEMDQYRRGRAPGEIPGLLRAELLGLGAAADAIQDAASEFEAVRVALDWARPGDLLVLPLHSERDRSMALLARLADSGWVPGGAME